MNDSQPFASTFDAVNNWLSFALTVAAGFCISGFGFAWWWARRLVIRHDREKELAIARKLADPREWDTEDHPKRSHESHAAKDGDGRR